MMALWRSSKPSSKCYQRKKKVLIIAILFYHKVFIHENLFLTQIRRPLQPDALGSCLGRLCQEPALSDTSVRNLSPFCGHSSNFWTWLKWPERARMFTKSWHHIANVLSKLRPLVPGLDLDPWRQPWIYARSGSAAAHRHYFGVSTNQNFFYLFVLLFFID